MRLRYQLALFTTIRTVINTLHRMVYPFLAVFARGLGVDILAMSFALTARSVVGTLGPFLASVADSRGRKFGMLAGLALFIGGTLLVVFFPSLPVLTLTLILTTLGKYLFDPSMQAYLGDRTSYEQRGLVIAVTEFGWSLAFVLGVPVTGFLIARSGWIAPFPLIALLAGLTLAVLFFVIPSDSPSSNGQPSVANPPPSIVYGLPPNFRLVLTSIPALAGLSIGLWSSTANEVVNLIFGVWLEDSLKAWVGPQGFTGILAFLNFFKNTLGLEIALLILASMVIGLSELSGESAVARFADQFGKPRAVALGLMGNICAALLLPWLGRSTLGALAGLFFFYITFEFTLVSSIPMMTEVLPNARATMMAFNVAALSLGRALGAPLAPFLYGFGFPAVAAGAVVFNLFAVLALRRMQKG
jgi:predicted MFS family arabinose efflux permease